MIFPTEYQYELLRKMTNRTWMERTGCLLHSEMFDAELEPAVKQVLDAWKKNRVVPSRAQLTQVCSKHSVKVPQGGVGDNFDFDHQEVLSFARDRILREQFAKAHLFMDDGKHDRAIAAIMEARKKFPRSGEDDAPDILTTKMKIPMRQKLISTGIDTLDKYLGGGVAAKELATVLAPTSGGKSSLLAFMAASAVSKGKKVWYATLEVSEADIRGKVQKALLRTQHVKEADWVKMGKKLAKEGARLQIVERPPHSIGVDDLDGMIPDTTDIVFIDYADYLRPPSDNPALAYESLGYIYDSLKGLSMRRNISVWTASQVNRSAYEADEIYTQHVEASLKKMMVTDIGVSVNQNRAEQEVDKDRGNCLGRMFIAKNRAGPRYVTIDVTINWGMTTFVCGRRA